MAKVIEKIPIVVPWEELTVQIHIKDVPKMKIKLFLFGILLRLMCFIAKPVTVEVVRDEQKKGTNN
jgi:hypothetical protein